jgi:hypothetical protein
MKPKLAGETSSYLKAVGYVGWQNLEDIRGAFLDARPDLSESTLYDDLIEPELGASIPASILYVPTFHSTEPARLIDRRLDYEKRRGVVCKPPTRPSPASIRSTGMRQRPTKPPARSCTLKPHGERKPPCITLGLLS